MKFYFGLTLDSILKDLSQMKKSGYIHHSCTYKDDSRIFLHQRVQFYETLKAAAVR